MRVLIPDFAATDSLTDNVAYTLRKMGHEVLTMPSVSGKIHQSPFWRLFFEAKEKLSSEFLTFNEQWLLKQLDTFKPNLVLTLTLILSDSVLFEVKKRKIHAVAWWMDHPSNLTRQGLLSKFWDFIYFKDPASVSKFNRVGLNAELLHEAMNPDWHLPISGQKNNRIIVAGNFYDYRNYLVKQLLEQQIDVELYGRRLANWVDNRIKEVHTGKYITRKEKSLIFGQGLACLNSTCMGEGNSMNCRAFEIAGAAGLQIMEFREIIPECFEPGKEILVFDSLDELFEWIDFAKKFPKESSEIRLAGHRRAVSEHVYEIRLNYILSKFK